MLLLIAPGAPIDISTSSRMLGTIVVTFQPTPRSMQNGSVTMYTVQFQNGGDLRVVTVVAGPGDLTATQTNLSPRSSYMVRIAATNGAGMGPFSTPDLTQTVLSIPIDVEFVSTPADVNPGVTQTSIPITLPPVANRDQFR